MRSLIDKIDHVSVLLKDALFVISLVKKVIDLVGLEHNQR